MKRKVFGAGCFRDRRWLVPQIVNFDTYISDFPRAAFPYGDAPVRPCLSVLLWRVTEAEPPVIGVQKGRL